MFLASRERFEQAMTECRRALRLDPLSLLVNFHVGWIYLLADRSDDALRQVQKLIEIEPKFFGGYHLMGAVYVTKGMYEEGLEALQKSLALGSIQISLSDLGATYGLLGKKDEALGMLNELLEVRKQRYVSAFNIARVYSGLGEVDQTLEWLENAVEERNGGLVFLNAEMKVGTGGVWGERVRTDPRLTNLVKRVGL
jgi:tetratricopeptide (TPR) repeat protein